MTNELRPFLKDLPEITEKLQVGDLFCATWWYNHNLMVGRVTGGHYTFDFCADCDEQHHNIRNHVFYADGGRSNLVDYGPVYNLTDLARQKLLPPEMTVILSEIVRELSTL